MDLGIGQLSIQESNETNEKKLMLQLQKATIEFDRTCSQVDKFIMYTENVDKVLANLKLAKTVVAEYGTGNGVLELINGQDGQLCQLMGWSELPVITDENDKEIAEAVTEGIGNIAAKTWEYIKAFFKMIAKMLGKLITAMTNLLKDTRKSLIQEGSRLARLKSPTSPQDVKIVFGAVKLDNGGICSTLQEYVDNEAVTSSLTDDQSFILVTAPNAVVAYAKGETVTIEIDIKKITNVTELLTTTMPTYVADAEQETPLSLHGCDKHNDVLILAESLRKILDVTKENIKYIEDIEQNLDMAAKAIDKAKNVTEEEVAKVKLVQDMLKASIDNAKASTSVVTTVATKFMQATSQIVEVKQN